MVSSTHVRTNVEKKINARNFFVSQLFNSKTQCFFSPHFFVFAGTSQADCGVDDINQKVRHPGIPSLAVYTRTRSILGDFVKVYHRDSARENCLNWRRDCWSLRTGCARIKLRGRGASNFSNSSTTKAKPTTEQAIS